MNDWSLWDCFGDGEEDGMVRRFQGTLSMLPEDKQVDLWCDGCDVAWVGGWDAAECPRCGDDACFSDYARANPDLAPHVRRENRRERLLAWLTEDA